MLYPNNPIFLMGHSLGGMSALSFVLSHSTEVQLLKGVIAHAPWLDTGKFLQPTPFLVSIVKLAAKFLPRFQIPTGLKIENSCYPDGYKKMALDSGYAIMTMTPYLFDSVLRNMKFVKENYHLFPKKLPLLVLQGTNDGCVNIENNIEWCNKVMKECGKEYIELKIIQDGPHDTTKWNTRKEALTSLFDFIERHI